MAFGHLPISFDDRVLQPRGWTVTQSLWAAELIRQWAAPVRILELCAGAGHIGLLTLALGEPSPHRLVAVDANPAACDFVRRNAQDAGLSSRVDVRLGPMDEVVSPDERFELVIADPPWVESDRIALFPDDPEFAIDGGHDGLDVARLCIRLSDSHLRTGGSLLLQLGTQSQADCIRAYVAECAPSLVGHEVWSERSDGALIHFTKGAPRE